MKAAAFCSLLAVLFGFGFAHQFSATPATSRCFAPLDRGPCNDFTVKWYFDRYSKRCREFFYGSCGGNNNRFNSLDECMRNCQNEKEDPAVRRCTQPCDRGNCTGNYPRYFFDTLTNQCTVMAWTGCGGNENRFFTLEQCIQSCGQFVVSSKAPSYNGPQNPSNPRTFQDNRLVQNPNLRSGSNMPSGYRNMFTSNDRRLPQTVPRPQTAVYVNNTNTLSMPSGNVTWVKLFHRQRAKYLQDTHSGKTQIVAVEHHTGTVRNGQLVNEHRYTFTTNGTHGAQNMSAFPNPVPYPNQAQRRPSVNQMPPTPRHSNVRPQQGCRYPEENAAQPVTRIPAGCNDQRPPVVAHGRQPQPPNQIVVNVPKQTTYPLRHGQGGIIAQGHQPQVRQQQPVQRPVAPAPTPARPPTVPPAVPRPPAISPQVPRPPAISPQVPRPPAISPQVPRPPAISPQIPRPPAISPQVPRPPANPPQIPRPPANPPQIPRPHVPVQPNAVEIERRNEEARKEKERKRKERKDAIFAHLKQQEREWKERVERLKSGQPQTPKNVLVPSQPGPVAPQSSTGIRGPGGPPYNPQRENIPQMYQPTLPVATTPRTTTTLRPLTTVTPFRPPVFAKPDTTAPTTPVPKGKTGKDAKEEGRKESSFSEEYSDDEDYGDEEFDPLKFFLNDDSKDTVKEVIDTTEPEPQDGYFFGDEGMRL